MPKSKHAPALFELISKPQRGEELRVRTPPEVGETPVVASPEPAAPPPAPALAFRSEPQAGSAADGGETEQRWEPAWRIAGGRIRFSLNQRGATIALGVAGLVLILVNYLGYCLGESRGRAKAAVDAVAALPVDGAQQIEDARRGPATRGLFDGVGEDPTVVVPAAQPASVGSPPTRMAGALPRDAKEIAWVSGHTYIVVQDFRKDARDEAEMAQEYLAQQGIASALLERSGNYPYRLITVRGFDRDDPGQAKSADDYLEAIRRLGSAYLQAGGRYDFKAYYKKLTGDTW